MENVKTDLKVGQLIDVLFLQVYKRMGAYEIHLPGEEAVCDCAHGSACCPGVVNRPCTLMLPGRHGRFPPVPDLLYRLCAALRHPATAALADGAPANILHAALLRRPAPLLQLWQMVHPPRRKGPAVKLWGLRKVGAPTGKRAFFKLFRPLFCSVLCP